jgi:hypothetical protein
MKENKKTSKYEIQSKFMVSIAGMLLLLVAGTILTPIQSFAAPERTTDDSGFLTSPSLKQGIHDEIRADLKNTNQSINQENLCVRSNTCRQSAIGENVLGNDNQVTGFADQSDKIQQSATANKTTPTQTPTATLTVTKIVSGTTTAVPSQFTIHVSGNNPNPPNFGGSATGTDVTLISGPFGVTETLPAGTFFTNTTAGDCRGTITAGQHLSCTITNTALTCAQCFTSLLNTTQLNAVKETFAVTDPCSINLIGLLITESDFREILILQDSISLTTANELIACLKAAGIVFSPENA